MADNQFLLHIIGDEVSPQSVDVEDLTALIRGFRGGLGLSRSIRGTIQNEYFLQLLDFPARGPTEIR